MDFYDSCEPKLWNGYLLRLFSNDYLAERKKIHSTDELVVFKHTSQRLQKIRKKHPKRSEYMKEKEETQVRISLPALPPGKKPALMTNLPTIITQKQLGYFYYQRCIIEKNIIY